MNILIVGLGSIAKKHIKVLRKIIKNVKIFALRSSKKPDDFPFVQNIYEIDEDIHKFDFAIISNPTSLHFKYIDLLSKKNIPLFIEKPAIHNLKNADFLINQIKEKKLMTYVACNLRFHPCIKFLKSSIKDRVNKINEINVYSGSYLPDWRPEQNYVNSYSANNSLGGGVHLDLIHEMDYVLWIFGYPKYNTSNFRKKSNLDINSYDYANYFLEYEDFTASIILNYYRRKSKRQIDIVFENESWTIDLINNSIINDKNQIIFKTENYNLFESYELQMKYFIKCYFENIPTMNTFEESIKTLSISLNIKNESYK